MANELPSLLQGDQLSPVDSVSRDPFVALLAQEVPSYQDHRNEFDVLASKDLPAGLSVEGQRLRCDQRQPYLR